MFAIACKVAKKRMVKLGTGVQIRARQPEYRGAQHFGVEKYGGDEEEELTEDEMAALAEGLYLEDWVPVAQQGEVLVNRQRDVVTTYLSQGSMI